MQGKGKVLPSIDVEGMRDLHKGKVVLIKEHGQGWIDFFAGNAQVSILLPAGSSCSLTYARDREISVPMSRKVGEMQ